MMVRHCGSAKSLWLLLASVALFAVLLAEYSGGAALRIGRSGAPSAAGPLDTHSLSLLQQRHRSEAAALAVRHDAELAALLAHSAAAAPTSPPDPLAAATVAPPSTSTLEDCFCRKPLPALNISAPMSPLIKLALRVALDRKVLLAVSTSDVREQLRLFTQNLQRLSITNVVIVALDDETMSTCPIAEHCVRLDGISQERGDKRERISAKKFGFIAELLAAGISVLLSDSDIVFFDNPFCHLGSEAATSDIMGMSDGWSPSSALGWHEVVADGPTPPPWQFRIVFLNSGFFYVRPSTATLAVFVNISARLAVENVWDQAAYNDEVWFPRSTGAAAIGTEQSHGGHQLRVTVLDWKLFTNSKVAIALGGLDAPIAVCPITMHINYHGEKASNMVGQADKYKRCLVTRSENSSAACFADHHG